MGLAFHSVRSFFYMGGYATFVWPAVILVFVLFLGYFLYLQLQFRRSVRRLKNLVLTRGVPADRP